MNDIQIDPRGPRFGAFFQLAFSIAALLAGANAGGIAIMAVLLVLFIPGAIIGPQATFQSWVFKKAVRPRLDPPKETESFRAPRFAQQMGLTFSILAVGSGLLSWDLGFFVFTGFVTFASFLNSVFDLCLGCEIYLLFKRATTRTAV
ncbi:DUF4395 domain-containing protein [Demequina subtropica]|uniref:DUF4395 domain-containing protein n=1 Tax=Demequina subtropica TaxID=1638989 RepID=UPI000785E299|nr:DUF4395 domain-containing protein [Demequina subtropica]